MTYPSQTPTAPLDAVCIGAGFAGLYAVHQLVENGFTVRGVEAAHDVGGTWLWNAYPGARCDIESFYYSYSFSRELEQEWTWSERYATQPEILRYIEHVADRFDLRRHFTFSTTVIGATWHEVERVWEVRLDSDEVVRCRFLISGVGCLSTTKAPDFPGLDLFGGRVISTGTWDVDLAELQGKRVGVIGTGSSGVQCIPHLAAVAGSLTVFQRTPNYVLPARNAPLTTERIAQVKANYQELRQEARASMLGVPETPPTEQALDVPAEERARRYEAAYRVSGLTSVGSVFKDLLTDLAANETASEFLRAKVSDAVEDPDVATALTPRFHPFGAKRTCLGTDYYETFNRDEVDLVNLRETPLVAVTEGGVRTTQRDVELDVLVLATGFDAVTGSILRLNIATSTGARLRDAWADGPRTFLGLMTDGFPNFFMITGPQSPSVMSNVVISIEQHVDFLLDLLRFARRHELDVIAARPDSQDAWVTTVDDTVEQTLYATTESWYRGSNIPGKPRAFLAYVGGVGAYRQICDEVAAGGYQELILESSDRGESHEAALSGGPMTAYDLPVDERA